MDEIEVEKGIERLGKKKKAKQKGAGSKRSEWEKVMTFEKYTSMNEPTEEKY